MFYVTSNEAAHPNGNQQEAHLRFLPFVFPQTKVSEGEKYEERPARAPGTFQILLHYESIATVVEIRVWWRADFQSGSRVLKKVF